MEFPLKNISEIETNNYDSAPIIESNIIPEKNDYNNLEYPLIETNIPPNEDNNDKNKNQKKNVNDTHIISSEDNKNYKKINLNNSNDNIRQKSILLSSYKNRKQSIFFKYIINDGKDDLGILTFSFFIIFCLSIAEVIIQFKNHNGINNLLIDDVILVLNLIILVVCCKFKKMIYFRICFILSTLIFVANFIIFFEIFYSKYKNNQ